ncbi:MAG: HAD-IA family hydrolase [Candidatus Protistobacter heckmanni]|nr:HAD-IA family hydrolase [Candidatus Protistobacter heckmanni]
MRVVRNTNPLRLRRQGPRGWGAERGETRPGRAASAGDGAAVEGATGGAAAGRGPVWLFDLDDTLHHASHSIIPQVNDLMTAYITRLLDGDAQAADRLRADYWRRYGATLLGLVRHHGVAAADFLAEVHAIPDLLERARFQRRVLDLLARLPGRKILLTNAPAGYALPIVRHTRLHTRFHHQVTVENMWVHRTLRPKPDRLMLQRLLARHRVSASRAVLVEDSRSHLQRYAKLGLSTVWVTGFLPAHARRRGFRPAYVDLKVKSVLDLLRRSSPSLRKTSHARASHP